MNEINSNDNLNVFKITEINREQAPINEINPLGIKRTHGGKETSRISIGIFPGLGNFAKVAIQEVSDAELKNLTDKKRNRCPLKIQDDKGQVKTVLVSINSLAGRLGISKAVLLKLAKEDSTGEGLARVLNQLSGMSESLIAQYPNKPKNELIYTALKICNYIEKNKDKLAIQLKDDNESITFTAEKLPPKLTKLKNSEQAQKLTFEKVSIFKDGKVLIHLPEIGKGGLKVVTAGFDFSLGKVAIAIPQPTSIESQEDARRETEVLAHYAKRQKDDPNFKGLIRTYCIRYLEIEQGGKVQKMPGFIHPLYNGDLFKFAETRAKTAPPGGPEEPLLNNEELELALDHTSEGLFHLHEDGYVHRDIKPDNLLCKADEKGQLSELVISDLGSCLKSNEEKLLKSLAGTTPLYCAPEMIGTSQDQFTHALWKKNDIWQLGCVFYQLITGSELPWVQDFDGNYDKFFKEMQDGQKVKDNYAKIKTAVENLETKYKALILGMLNPDPARRLEIHQVRAVLKGDQTEIKNVLEKASDLSKPSEVSPKGPAFSPKGRRESTVLPPPPLELADDDDSTVPPPPPPVELADDDDSTVPPPPPKEEEDDESTVPPPPPPSQEI